MEQEVISKKELLDETGISYGQLYRWKRKNIIPEEWFIKKSSYTGQETFFPKEKILERVEAIKGMKDEYSLDELSAFFSPKPAEVTMKEDLLEKFLKPQTLKAFGDLFMGESYDFHSILFLSLAEDLRVKLNDDQCRELVEFLAGRYRETEHKTSELVGFEKNGVTIWVIISPPSEVIAEAEMLVRINLEDKVNQLKKRLSTI
ncbi:DUF4004 family protein [Metabacillus indicus]|uniref:DUF4004 family protein n=1 Tax=Metabacillus indicus TaxID=246786 RepID=UPI0024916264|nr:DUF4004 family protein [Metabacillus indicus]